MAIFSKKAKEKSKKDKKVSAQENEEAVASGSSKLQLFLYAQFPSFYRFFSRGKTPTKGPEAGKGAKAGKPRLPQVNLLPPRLAFEAARRATRRGLALVAVGLVVVLALVFFGQATSIQLANQTLASAQEQVSAAQKQAQEFQPVGRYFDSLQTRLNIANSSSGQQINYDEAFAAAISLLPPRTLALSYTARVAQVSVPSPTGAPSISDISACRDVPGAKDSTEGDSVALSEEVVGCFEMAGIAPDRKALADLQAGLSQSSLFVLPVVKEQASRSSRPGVTGFSFTVNSGLSLEALTGATVSKGGN